MTYKRYIKKHGKRLGPYYYENVRGKDGKVKSVYIGRHPPKQKRFFEKKIVFSLIIGFLIVAGIYFFAENKIQLVKEDVKEEIIPFDVDQLIIKTLVKTGEYGTSVIRVMNIALNESSINIEIDGLDELVAVSEKDFVIKPGQTKIIYLNFSSIFPEKNIEYRPDVYVGKLIISSASYKRKLPIIVEVESKDVLFDMNLNVPVQDREVEQGGKAVVEVRLFNLAGRDPVSIDMGYYVKDLNGNTIITESETVVVTTQASFFKTVKIPVNLREGTYVFAARAEYASSVGTSSYMFDVLKPVEEKSKLELVKICKDNALCWLSVFAALVMIFSIGAYVYFLVGAWFFSRFYGKVKIKEKEEPGKKIAKAYKRIVLWLILILLTVLIAGSIYYYIQKIGVENVKESLKEINLVYASYLSIAVILFLILFYIYKKRGKIKRLIEKWRLEKGKKEKLKKQKKAEGKRKKEPEKKREEEGERQRKLEEKERKAREAEKEKRARIRKRRAREFLHKVGLYKTEAEKRKIRKIKEEERKRKEIEKKERERLKELKKEGKKEEKKRIAAERERQRKLEEERKEKEKKEKLKEFNNILNDIDSNIKSKKVNEAARLYTNLKERYNKIIKDDIGKQGKIILYNKVNDVYKQLESAKLKERIEEEERKKGEKTEEKVKEEEEKREREKEEERQRVLEEKRKGEERGEKEEEKKREEERREKERLRELEKKGKEEEEGKREAERKKKEEKIKELEERRKEEGNEEEKRIKNIEKKIAAEDEKENKLIVEIKRIKEERGLILKSLSEREKKWEEEKKKNYLRLEELKQLEKSDKLIDDEYKGKVEQLENNKKAKLEEIENERKRFEEGVLKKLEKKGMEKWKKLEITAKRRIEGKRIERLEKDEKKKFDGLRSSFEKEYRKEKKELRLKINWDEIEKEKKAIENKKKGRGKKGLGEKEKRLSNRINELGEKIKQIRGEKGSLGLEIKLIEKKLKVSPGLFGRLGSYIQSSREERKRKGEEKERLGVAEEEEKRKKEPEEEKKEEEAPKEEEKKEEAPKEEEKIKKVEKREEKPEKGFLQKIGLFKSKEEKEDISRLREEEKLKRVEEKRKVEEELESLEKEGVEVKDTRKEKLNEFNNILKDIDNNIKNKKINEAARLYANLKELYNEIMKEDIGKQGKIILYNKINEVFKELKSAKK